MEKRLFPCKSLEYDIEIADVESRKEEIVEMLIDNFLRDETLVKSLISNANLTKLEEENLKFDEYLLMSTGVDGATVLIATDKETKRLAGCLVIIVRDNKDNTEKLSEEEKKLKNNDFNESTKPYESQLKSQVIKDFFDYIEEINKQSLSLFDKYPNCKTYAEFELIGINKLDRRKGLALDLFKAGLTVVKEMPDVSVLSGVYTSVYTKIIAEKIGKTVISNVDVTELKDKNGKPVFQDTKPHNIVSLMAMEL